MRLCHGISGVVLTLLLTGRVESFKNVVNFQSKALPFQNKVQSTSTCGTSTLAFLSDRITSSYCQSSSTALFAKKKKGPAGAAAAALAALEELDAQEDAGMSKKDQLAAQKQAKKEAKKAKTADPKAAALEALDLDALDEDEGLSKKEQMMAAKKAAKEAKKRAKKSEMEAKANQEEEAKKENAKMRALKALEQMERDEAAAAAAGGDDADAPKLSKKELKALKKAEEKQAAKEAAKAAKKAAKAEVEAEAEVNGDAAPAVNGDAPPEEEKKEITLEERIRKERPPPRIRVMESSQPDYSALRLENVAITFRNQEVLKGVTWGVQTGDRIGLVGANGGGKTTQLRILSGEMEPTAGDVVKSSKDLRVSILRQEFVDELVPERSLLDEFMSVFTEENKILEDITATEKELEQTDPADTDTMQNILDRLQNLQSKADVKGVYALESRARKIMDLMGFTEEEGKSAVSMFSGGWKMRIGLGKVLCKEPNILLLDEPTNHLDLESVEWLENFLRNQNIPMVIVSHDREFLDQVCTKIVDTEGGLATEYDGNYSQFLKSKKGKLDRH